MKMSVNQEMTFTQIQQTIVFCGVKAPTLFSLFFLVFEGWGLRLRKIGYMDCVRTYTMFQDNALEWDQTIGLRVLGPLD